MSERLILKPVDGRRVRRPDGRPLSALGELVVVNTYWSRRLAAGDVVGTPPVTSVSAADPSTETNRPKSKRE